MNYSRAIHSITGLSLNGSRAEFHGTNGSVILEILKYGVYKVSYHLDEFTPGAALEKAAEYYFDSEREPGESLFWEEGGNQNPDFYTLLCGRDRITIGSKDAVVTVFHDDKLVHGGIIGTEDTVLPRYPLRILGGSGEETKARLNFKLHDADLFYGLGDKAGGLNKRGQRYHMYNRDALGYNASFSDPLYKSIPFMIKQNREDGINTGLFFPIPFMGEIDLGRESNYFFSVKMTGGPFSYIVFTGDSPWDILDGYTWLTGRPSLPPLFTFGFLGSSMNYTDPDDADRRVCEYFDRIEENRIPCEGFYFSSGYIKADNGERYTFEWNKDKFPDPAAAVNSYRERGYHIAMNIKPGFLLSHPRYSELAEKGYFIKDNNGNPYSEYYWGNNASFLDFSNPAALKWWKLQLKEKFLDYGVSGIWNDNNEFELEDRSLEAQKVRPFLPVLMCKASWDVMLEQRPGKRPWIISRSGSSGIQKYARTWTGDNVSDWESMKYNTLMGLGLGLSGVPYYGHDIGGFFGEMPDEKQFIRWCQSAVFQPRFVIHSWNPDGNPTEVWSYPESTDAIRDLVELHYEFMPYIYNAAIEASLTGIPMERPLVLMFEDDKEINPDCLHYMFGEDILVLSAVEEDQDQVSCYLPENTCWFDPLTQEYFRGGNTVCLDYPYAGIRYLVKTGGIIFQSPGCRKLDSGYFKQLKISVFPEEGRLTERVYREDNGEDAFREGSFNSFRFSVDFTEGKGILEITKTASADWAGEDLRTIELVLPEEFNFIDEQGNGKGNSIKLNGLPSHKKIRFAKRL